MVTGGRPLFQFLIGDDPLDYVEGVARCRNCIGCKSDRARDVSLRASHEARFIGCASFLTLTYDQAHLPWDSLRLSDEGRRQALAWPASVMPWGGSLRRRDVVLFMKRLRDSLRRVEGVRVRAFARSASTAAALCGLTITCACSVTTSARIGSLRAIRSTVTPCSRRGDSTPFGASASAG